MNELTKLWECKFNKIYCLHFLGYEDRVNKIKKELERVGLLDAKNFCFYYTFDSPLFKFLQESKVPIANDEMKTKLTAFKCGLGHYSIMKEADGFHYNKILIIEDDVCFLKDLNLIKNLLTNLPEDYDITLLDCWPFHPAWPLELKQKYPVNDYYSNFKDRFNSGACYALSQKGYKKIIEKQETMLRVADNVYWNTDDDGLKRCFSNFNLTRQNPTDPKKVADMNLLYSLRQIDNSMYNM